MNDKISVVLPTYNGAEFIGRSIESVLAQSYENWELIIVNDCSTDNTKEVIETYLPRDSRIRLISNETNKKLPASLNVGFDAAEGQLFTWTSDDNAYHNDAFSVMVDVMNGDSSIDMVYADCNITDLTGNFIEYLRAESPEKLKYGSVIGACFLYKRSLAEKIGKYDTQLFLAEDYDYWIRAYLNGKLCHIEKILYDYGRHDNNLTATRKNEILKATYNVKNKHFDELLSTCKNQEERNDFFDQMLFFVTDKQEQNRIRKYYCCIDKMYALMDMKRRVGTSYGNAKGKVKKVIKKILRYD